MLFITEVSLYLPSADIQTNDIVNYTQSMVQGPTGMKANELDKTIFLIYVGFFSKLACHEKNPVLETSPQIFQEY